MYFQVFSYATEPPLVWKTFCGCHVHINQTDKNIMTIECDVLSGPTPTRPIRYRQLPDQQLLALPFRITTSIKMEQHFIPAGSAEGNGNANGFHIFL